MDAEKDIGGFVHRLARFAFPNLLEILSRPPSSVMPFTSLSLMEASSPPAVQSGFYHCKKLDNDFSAVFH